MGERDRSGCAGLFYRLYLVGHFPLRWHPLPRTYHELSAQMITTAITVGSNGDIVLGAGATYGILLAILVSHGIVCSSATRILARLNLLYVVVNSASPSFICKRAVSLIVIQLERP